MKLVFERDIPEFHGKTWPERITLRNQARTLDRRIWVRTAFLSLFWVSVPSVLMVLRQHQVLPPPSWRVLLIYLVVLFPLSVLAQALWVNPLVKAALQSAKPNQALQPTAGAGGVPLAFQPLHRPGGG